MNTVIAVDPRTDPVWRKLVAEHASSVFDSPQWLTVLSATYGWVPRALVLLDEAMQPRAGIPFCRIADIMGERIVTLPFSDHCDPIAQDHESWSQLIESLLLESCPIAIRCVHNGVPVADGRFQLVKRARWHGLDLTPGLDRIWHGVDEAARRAIRKSEQDGLVIEVADGLEDVRAFFQMHLEIRKYKYQMLAQPFEFFENLWHGFLASDQGCLMLAKSGEKVIGGVMFLIWKDTLYYKFNASARADLSHRPNDRLIWEGIRYGRARGCRQLDFGLSDWDQEGLVRYKRKFGSEEKTISFLRYTPDEAARGQEKLGRDLLSSIAALFVDQTVPDVVTERAGQQLYRYFA